MSKSKYVITFVTALLLSVSTGNAGNDKGKGGGKKNGGNALIGFDILNAHCDVEFSSTKDLSNIVIEYASGSPIKYDNLSGYNYTIPGAVLEEATAVYVKSGNNGSRGKKNRGYGAPIGVELFTAVTECFAPVPACDLGSTQTELLEDYVTQHPLYADAGTGEVPSFLGCELRGNNYEVGYNLSADVGVITQSISQWGSFFSIILEVRHP